MLIKYESMLLEGWEDTYKKAQLTLWILLALKDGPKHMAAIKDFIVSRSSETITADDKSMYRALRRFYEAELIAYDLEKSEGGPDKKVYKLSDIGTNVLMAFIERNITNVYFAKANKDLF